MKHIKKIFESSGEKNSFSLRELYCIYSTSADEIRNIFLKEDLAILECNKLNQDYKQKYKEQYKQDTEEKIYVVLNLDDAIDRIKDNLDDYYSSINNEDY